MIDGLLMARIIGGLLAVLLLAIAVGKHLRVRELESELHAATVRAETAEAWAQRWEELAEEAGNEAEAAVRRHGEVQALYCRLVRESMAASWPTVQHYAAMRRRS